MTKLRKGYFLFLVVGVSLGFLIGKVSKFPSTEKYNEDLGIKAKTTLNPSSKETRDRGRSQSSRLQNSQQDVATTLNTLSALSFLAEENPILFERLSLRFFDQDLNVRVNDWELLGISETEATRVKDKLDIVVSEIKQLEVESFEILENSDDFLKLGLPPLTKEQREYYLGLVNESFAVTFSPKTAELMSERFLSHNPSVTGGIMGLTRVISVTPNELTGGFTISTGVSTKNATLEQMTENPDGYTRLNSLREVKELPSQWNHLLLDQ